jgi:hypothetical protein
MLENQMKSHGASQTVVGNALYNASASTDFELHALKKQILY